VFLSWLMTVILRVVRLIETVLLFLTCVIFLSFVLVFVADYASIIHTESATARTLHTLSGNILENLLERQNGEQSHASKSALGCFLMVNQLVRTR
jgi:hypothetical protein